MKNLIYMITFLIIVIGVGCSQSDDANENSSTPMVQVDVSFPESGDVVVRLSATGTSDSIDFYGSSRTSITQARGDVENQSIVVDYGASDIDRTTITSNEHTYVQDLQGAFYIDDIFQFSDARSVARAPLSHLEECEVQAHVLATVLTSIALSFTEIRDRMILNDEDHDTTYDEDLVRFYTLVALETMPRFKTLTETYKRECIDYYDDTPPSTTIPELYKPTESRCGSGGGTWYANEEECAAPWAYLNSICSVPGLEVWESIITGCGGVINDRESNDANEAYIQCREEVGYVRNFNFWSGSPSETEFEGAWMVNISHGSEYATAVSQMFFVRCIDEQE